MAEKVIILDFPDAQTAQIYAQRYFCTAKILGLEYAFESYRYGLDRFYFKAAISGDPKDLKSFLRFVEETLQFEPQVKFHYE